MPSCLIKNRNEHFITDMKKNKLDPNVPNSGINANFDNVELYHSYSFTECTKIIIIIANPRMAYPCSYDIVSGASNSPLCTGACSALPSANLLSLGIMQACLPSVLAEPQLCLCSFDCGISVVIGCVCLYVPLQS